MNSLLVDRLRVVFSVPPFGRKLSSGDRYVVKRVRLRDLTCTPSDSMTPFVYENIISVEIA